MQLAVSNRRVDTPMYRAAGATEWQKISWDDVLNRIARHIKDSRDRTFVTIDKKGNLVNRTDGIAFAGGADVFERRRLLRREGDALASA